jgi:hypothetical protein
MGCLESKPLFNFAECRTIMERNDLYGVKNYIKSKNKLNYCDWADIIIMAISIKGFSYTNFVSMILEYNLIPVLFTTEDKFYYKLSYFNNEKSSYCYMYYDENKLYLLLKFNCHNQFPGLAMLKTCIIKNYLNLINKILPQLINRKINLYKYYPLLSTYFNPNIVYLFVKYDPDFKPHIYLSADQLTTFKLSLSNKPIKSNSENIQNSENTHTPYSENTHTPKTNYTQENLHTPTNSYTSENNQTRTIPISKSSSFQYYEID